MQKTNVTRENETQNHVCHLSCNIAPSHAVPWVRMQGGSCQSRWGYQYSEPFLTGYLEMQIHSRPNPKSQDGSCENVMKMKSGAVTRGHEKATSAALSPDSTRRQGQRQGRQGRASQQTPQQREQRSPQPWLPPWRAPPRSCSRQRPRQSQRASPRQACRPCPCP